MINNSIDHELQYLACLTLVERGPARLEFTQLTEYKAVPLLAINVSPIDEELLKSHLTYRFNMAKAKMIMSQEKLKEVVSLIKTKNPTLLGVLGKETT